MKMKEKGFTLIEFMVVIALIGIGLLFVVSQFKDAGDQNKSQTAIKNITQLASGVTTFKNLRTGYTGVTETGVAGSSAAPSNMLSAGVLTNIFGSPVTILGASTIYTVTYPGVPHNNCVDIATKLVSAFKNVYVTAALPANLILNVADAQSKCLAGNSILVFEGN